MQLWQRSMKRGFDPERCLGVIPVFPPGASNWTGPMLIDLLRERVLLFLPVPSASRSSLSLFLSRLHQCTIEDLQKSHLALINSKTSPTGCFPSYDHEPCTLNDLRRRLLAVVSCRMMQEIRQGICFQVQCLHLIHLHLYRQSHNESHPKSWREMHGQ